MKQSNVNYKLGVLCLIALVSCGASNKGGEDLAPGSESSLLSAEGDLDRALLALDEIEAEADAEAESESEESGATRRSRIKAYDKQFLEDFKILSKEEKIEKIKELKEDLMDLLDLPREERKEAAALMEPPLPSKKIRKKLFKKKVATTVQ